MIVVTPEQFLADFPEFAGAPASKVAFWLNVAGQMVDSQVWGGLGTVGVELFAAHNISLDIGAAAGGAGSAPGGNSGIRSSESGGGLSVGYSNAGTLADNAGHWNLTTYGTRFIELRRMFGVGPIHIGGGFSGYGGMSPWCGIGVCGPGYYIE